MTVLVEKFGEGKAEQAGKEEHALAGAARQEPRESAVPAGTVGTSAKIELQRWARLAPEVPKGRARRLRWKEWLGVQMAAAMNDLFGPREKSAFGVLMYHRVIDAPPRVARPTWNVPPARLEQQLSGLLARGWVAWPLSQVLDCRERGLPIPRKTFVVTFDDGYVNNFTQALPILTRLGVPATVFLATAYLDSEQPFPSDDWEAAGQPGVPREAWRPLTTDECDRMTASGLVELGAHTHTHADFRGKPEELAADLEENLTVMRERFGVEQPAFAFPYGTKADGFASSELASTARGAGMRCCLTTEGQVVRPGDSEFDWGRFAAEDHDTSRTLAARLGGWQEAVRARFKISRSRFKVGQ
jgi:peptidoglycan/xylan/chitin deacetylase (PgdA/CDA1 family)